MEANTVAVLPFNDLSSQPGKSFFADGITEEIINALSKIDQLRVTSRISSFSLKNKNLTALQIAEQLQVAYLLEGSVRLEGSQVRIQANLIETATDLHFWSKSWTRELTTIFEVQDEISLLIADQLQEQLGNLTIQDQLVIKQTSSIDAYTLYLQGNQLFNRWNPTDVKQSIVLFEQALSIDPFLADAYASLADANGFLAVTGFADPVESWQKVKTYTEKALSINPKHPGAHYQLANLAFFTQFNYREAVQHALKTIEYKPNYPEAQQFLSLLFLLRKDYVRAEKHLSIALEIDPLSSETRFYQAYFEFRKHNFEKALELTTACLEENSNNIPAYTVKAYSLLALGQTDKAIAFTHQQPEEHVVTTDRWGITCLAHVLDKRFDADYQTHFDLLLKEAHQPFGIQAHAYLYLIYALQNQPDSAFEWVKRSEEFNSPVLFLFFNGPFTENLHSDARFQEWEEKLFAINESKFETDKSTAKALLDEETSERILQQLLTYFEEEEPFLQPDLTLRSLANELNVNTNQLSWLINQKLKKNFSNFINSYRVKRFQELAVLPENQHISLIGIAYESGFNSKTVFNTYFKKETGLTPKAWLKIQAK